MSKTNKTTKTSKTTKSFKKPSKKGWHWKDYFVSSPLKLDKNHPNPTVFVAMSGGVDSSATAYLLKNAGYQVVGVFMKNWSFPIKRIDECPLYQDYKDMVSVCKFLDIPYLVFSFEDIYRKRVIDPFFRDYRKGLTPNPDVLCNKEIKFGPFLKEAVKLGADYIATGHHIRSRRTNKGYHLLKGIDPIKDQTYFVYPLTQAQLSKCIFPVGEYCKSEIRELAKLLKLPTAEKRDSQGICFIGRIDAKDFLKTKLEQKTGDIVDKNGKKLGEHEGAWFYTIGQRRISGLSGLSKPMYVIGTNVKKNQVIVGDDKDTYTKIARVKSFHWVNPTEFNEETLLNKKLTAKSRYTPQVTGGILKKDAKGYYFAFTKPERAVTSGQCLVLYKGDICLGGGVIQ